jgi:excinuclease ABC subunit B
LREGLDLPEVTLVAILDADKEGFLRSTGSLIQTIGRAARNVNGIAILYADVMTDSMRRAISETDRRRRTQVAYNEENGITPQTIVKAIDSNLIKVAEADYVTPELGDDSGLNELTPEQRASLMEELEHKMREAAKNFDFETAAQFRDRLKALREPRPFGEVSSKPAPEAD